MTSETASAPASSAARANATSVTFGVGEDQRQPRRLAQRRSPRAPPAGCANWMPPSLMFGHGCSARWRRRPRRREDARCTPRSCCRTLTITARRARSSGSLPARSGGHRRPAGRRGEHAGRRRRSAAAWPSRSARTGPSADRAERRGIDGRAMLDATPPAAGGNQPGFEPAQACTDGRAGRWGPGTEMIGVVRTPQTREPRPWSRKGRAGEARARSAARARLHHRRHSCNSRPRSHRARATRRRGRGGWRSGGAHWRGPRRGSSGASAEPSVERWPSGREKTVRPAAARGVRTSTPRSANHWRSADRRRGAIRNRVGRRPRQAGSASVATAPGRRRRRRTRRRSAGGVGWTSERAEAGEPLRARARRTNCALPTILPDETRRAPAVAQIWKTENGRRNLDKSGPAAPTDCRAGCGRPLARQRDVVVAESRALARPRPHAR